MNFHSDVIQNFKKKSVSKAWVSLNQGIGRERKTKGESERKKQIDMGYRHRVMRERERSRAIS